MISEEPTSLTFIHFKNENIHWVASPWAWEEHGRQGQHCPDADLIPRTYQEGGSSVLSGVRNYYWLLSFLERKENVPANTDTGGRDCGILATQKQFITGLKIIVASKTSIILLDSWIMTVCNIFYLEFLWSFPWAHGMRTEGGTQLVQLVQTLLRTLHVQAASMVLSHCAVFQRSPTRRRLLSDHSSDEELSCKMWTVSRYGFIIQPKYKLQGSSLLWAPMTQAPLQVSVLIKSNYT